MSNALATKLPLTSENILGERLDALRSLFPEVFTEGKVDFERLRAALGGAIETSRERYGLSWAGKSEAIRAVQMPSIGTLQPMPDESVNFETSENLIIEGDNLEVLKLLQKSYHGRVKMIYIDPPYNTGNEFIYPDDFIEGLDSYLRYSGQADKEGTRQTTNIESVGRFHSRWLTMMHPRLFLARNLLCEDGVIFISIDDNEVKSLRALMDEVFGEENFVGQIVWKARVSEDSRAKTGLSTDHEYILCYRRTELGLLRGSEKDLDKFANPDDDNRGPWRSADLTGLATIEQRPNLHYDLEDPATGMVYKCPPKGWRYEPTTMQTKIFEGRILFPKGEDGRPRHKLFLNEMNSLYKNMSSVISEVNTGQGTKEINDLFEGNIFAFPKPSKLIGMLAEQITARNEIILDFFAGSGTTAQAVMGLNEADGGNRRFILVQLPEKTERPDYPTITDITRERVRRVIAKLDKADEGKLELTTRPDRGFKAFRLTSSNFQVWNPSGVDAGSANLAQQLELFAEHVKPDRSQQDILFELILKAGLPLTAKTEALQVAGQTVYSVEDKELMICLENPVTYECLHEVIALAPERVICLDSAFLGNDKLKTNVVLEMKSHGVTFRTV